MMMIGKGMPIAHKSTERMKSPNDMLLENGLVSRKFPAAGRGSF
jgi:hypothetical protein